MGLPRLHLKVFRDESDLTGVEYQASIERHLSASSRLIVLCSPRSRASPYVNDEIERFVKLKGAANVLSVLLAGVPNNETKPGQEAQMAFPEALVAAMRVPMAVGYRDFDLSRNSVTRGAFYGSWCILLANIYGLSRSQIEERESRRRAKRLGAIVAATAGAVAALSLALVVTVTSRNEATRQRDAAELASVAERHAKDEALQSADAERKAKEGEMQQRLLAE